MFSVKLFETDSPTTLLSVALMLMLEDPADVGVPLMTPVAGFRFSPPGNEPESIAHA
jgi:hypothetical protein